MRGLRILFVAALATAIVGFAAAQPPRGGGQGKGGFQGGFMQMRNAGAAFLLTQESVQKELKVTDEQKEKLKDLAEKQQEKTRDQMRKMREAIENGEQPDREAMQKMMREANDASEKALKEILKDDQSKRLKQIVWQRAGTAVFTDKDVATPLKLTDEQTGKIKTMNEELTEDVGAIFRESRGGNQQEAQQKIEALRKETMEKAEDLLTADQKKQFKELLGTKFEGKIEMPRMEGGRGGFRKGGDKEGEKKKDPPAKRGDGF